MVYRDSPAMKTLSDIRSTFLEFYRGRGHEIVASSSLVPRDDPSLLFTNAGMVQFKNVFTGLETRAYSRAATAQKCVRAGGKHNDLDNVGYTARHHTFFEMLGNFSFGDYFKEEAILSAWTLVAKEFALPTEKILVTVYAEDDEAFALWRKIAGLPEARIIRIATADNFWSMGDTGPCGPCSELFYDHGPAVKGGPPGSAEADGDRFTEFWNLVFMQFEQKAGGAREKLPKPSIDTGMGLERIAAILQGVHDNYETDLFRTLIAASVELTGVAAQGAQAPSHRVIADHLRAASFLIADGVFPSNEGRGYVLRRILRRAMRHAHILGAADPLLHRLVPTLTSLMGGAYPELPAAQKIIAETLHLEETRFREMLARGLKLLDEATAGLSAGGTLSGEVAFRLYDTFGFPLDLTQDALKSRRIGVDVEGFNSQMERQRETARASWAGSGEAATAEVYFRLLQRLGASEFLGYDTLRAEARVLALLVDGREVESVQTGARALMIVDRTPFYAEAGGQIGDGGRARSSSGAELDITDVQRQVGELFVHSVTVTKGSARAGDALTLEVDRKRRDQTRANHSATHLLHEALRRTLGPHVLQKGSLVAPDRLRFDFAQPKPVTEAELETIEAMVNAKIRDNTEVSTRVMTQAAATEAGALALFGEKYGEAVRVLAMGEDADSGRSGAFSVELCGGTHVRRLGDIALFKIIAESGVAAGVRRIEALTGEAARRHFARAERTLQSAADTLKVAPDALPERVKQLAEERRRLERELTEAKKALALGGGASPKKDRVRNIGGLKYLGDVVEGIAAKDLRALIDSAKKELGSGIVAFVGVNDGKAALAVGVTADLTARVSAVDLVREGVEALGGKGGGGRPDMAQAGGPDGAKAADALAAIEKALGALAA
jgi:alanyl-tRNA synthetase